MNLRLRDVIRKNQAEFRIRVFQLRQIRITNREEFMSLKARIAKERWNSYLVKWEMWQSRCFSITCEGCDNRLSECACMYVATPDILTSMLRRLAKINPCSGLPGHLHDENKSGGPPGFRVCGKNNWDNAVRAHEEDR